MDAWTRIHHAGLLQMEPADPAVSSLSGEEPGRDASVGRGRVLGVALVFDVGGQDEFARTLPEDVAHLQC